MDSEKWQNIKNKFSAVVELPEEDRSDFFAAETDEEIRREVKKLLDAHDKADDFIDTPILVKQKIVEDAGKDDFVGNRIENYSILEKIGTGGMGTVYLATRTNSDFKQKVALKIIKRGMDSEAILKRFSVERRILSTLKHPNIAQLIDGGISKENLPFFVMEYVEGKPLNKFCLEHRYSLDERLELFRQICSAVDHAHKNLVVHRDLKPSNILVTTDGIPKLLDFGIAKLLSDEDAEITVTQTKMLTPEYASPEQFLGKNVTTATDIYSLGVILYELLSGHRPFETKGKSLEEIIQSICEILPERPSSVFSSKFKGQSSKSENKTTQSSEQGTTNNEQKTNPQFAIRNSHLLKGDLDNIILKALRKEPSERYGSVQQFSDDISRYLNGLPILARPQTFKYRFGKYFKRNKTVVLSAMLVLISLISGISATIWQSVVAKHERERAERQFAQTRKIANSLLFEIHDSITDLPGATASRELIVKRALEYLNSLSAEVDNDPELLLELSIAYRKVGDIQGETYQANTGDTKGSEESYRKSLEMQEQLLSTSPEDLKIHQEVLQTASQLGDNFFSQGKNTEAENAFKRAVDSALFVAEKEPQNHWINSSLAFNYLRLSWIINDKENRGNEPDYFELARQFSEKSLASNPEDDYSMAIANEIYSNIGNQLGNPDYNDLGKPAEAMIYIQKSLTLRQKLVEKNPESYSSQNVLGIGYKDVGDIFLAQKKVVEAIENYEKALSIHQKLAENDEKNVNMQGTIAFDLNKLGNALLQNGEIEKSLEKHRESVLIMEKIYVSNKANIMFAHTLASSLESLGDALVVKKQFADALSVYKRSLELEEGMNSNQADREFQRNIARLYFKLGKLKNEHLKNQLQPQEIASDFQKSVEFFTQIKSKSFLSPTNENLLRQAQNELAKLNNKG